jgi:hypothetical protein
MRLRRALFLGLLISLLVGCATDQPARSTSWLNRFRTLPGPTGPDVVQLDVALLERPVEDSYINGELWTLADEQAVSLEQRAGLEDNGLRVCQVGGITPARLQSLLTSERSCANPHRIQLHAGNPTTLSMGPIAAHCQFQISQEDHLKEILLDQAKYELQVVASLTDEGKTRLRFTPQIRHGEAVPETVPVADRSGYVLRFEPRTESYSSLSWEVTLAPNEYVVVGGRIDRPESLGYQWFVRRDEPVPVQRLLVIRTSRQIQGMGPDASFAVGEEEPTPSKVPPLALQAAWTSARASAP